VCGNGPFPARVLEVTSSSNKVISTDLNADGLIDLVVGSTFRTGLDVLMQRPGGTFESTGTFSQSDKADRLSAADMTGNGVDNVVVSGVNYVEVLQRSPTDSLELLDQVQFGDFLRDSAIGDVDGDGLNDIVALKFNSPELVIALNQGGGSFIADEVIPCPADIRGFELADVTGDGSPDLLLVFQSGLTVFLGVNDGAGDFSEPTPIVQEPLFGGNADDVLTADIDGDGDTDFALRFVFVEGTAMYENDGAGGFVRRATLSNEQGGTSRMLADINGDALPEYLEFEEDPPLAVVRRNLGSWAFGPEEQTLLPAWQLEGANAADVNENGTIDLALVSNGRLTFVPCTRPGGLPEPGFTQIEFPESGGGLAVDDLNNDGHQDVMMRSIPARGFFTRLGRGDGTFQDPLLYFVSSTAPGAYTLGDIDGDQTLDVVFGVGNSSFRSALGNGDGTFRPWVIATPRAIEVEGLALGHLDDDDAVDAVISDDGRDVIFAFGNGDGTFDASLSLEMSNSAAFADLHISDLDGDTIADVLAGHTNAVTWYRGLGNRAFESQQTLYSSNTTPHFEIRDLEPDGDADLISGNGEILINLGNAFFVPSDPPSEPGGSRFVLADVDNDGEEDIVGINRTADILTRSGEYQYSIGTRHGIFASLGDLEFADFDEDGLLDMLATGGGLFGIFFGSSCPAPCPADLDGSGVLNFDDIDAFVHAFLAGDLSADLTGDGFLNIADVEAFVDAFLAGCS